MLQQNTVFPLSNTLHNLVVTTLYIYQILPSLTQDIILLTTDTFHNDAYPTQFIGSCPLSLSYSN